MKNIVKIKQIASNEEQELHPFHEHLIDVCGVGYYDFRDFLNNLEDEDILEEIDEYVVNSRENLINKYKTMHTDLMKEFESDNLVNVWEMEMLRTKLEMVTTFLKDLRGGKGKN